MNYYKEINPLHELPPTNKKLAIQPARISDEVFAVTDNGLTVAYYDYEEKVWRSAHRDNYSHVKYWLKKIKAK